MAAIKGLFHATATVPDYERTLSALSRLFGIRVLEFGVQTHPNVGRRGGMTWLGDNALEIAQPIVPGGPGTRFLERFGAGLSSLAVRVASVDDEVARLERAGVGIAARPAPDFFFSHPRDTEGILIEWWSGEGAFDPRLGGYRPIADPGAIARVAAIAFVGALVADPPRAAARLSMILDSPVTMLENRGARHPVAGIDLGDSMLALYDLTEASIAGWDLDSSRPRTHALGLLVDEIDRAEAALRDAGWPAAWRDGNHLYLSAAICGGLPVVLSDRLLGGDRRSIP